MNPKALENRPPCHQWMSEYIQAFNVLSSTRQYGMGPNPIQLTEILAYIQIYRCSEPETLIKYVLKMDGAYLQVKAKKQEEKGKQSNGQRPGTDGGRRNSGGVGR